MKPTLVILAAGMGSRYGGLKQIDPVGPSGQTIMDYSIYDAARAGFGKVVFVIREGFADLFKREVGARAARRLAVDYAYQELSQVPGWFTVPADRQKPWGTAHAIMSTRALVKEPFAAINADDFYGREGFERMARHLETTSGDFAMVGYVLRGTLSEHGSVARGVCQIGQGDYLETVVEHLKIERQGQAAVDRRPEGDQPLTGDELVSMNLWGFTPALFDHLQTGFERYLRAEGDRPKSEFLLPTLVDRLIKERQARVKVLRSSGSWFGVTYPEDKPRVMENIRTLISQGVYPESLQS
jgi:NDP-sugar pyrophosphorylase family protein